MPPRADRHRGALLACALAVLPGALHAAPHGSMSLDEAYHLALRQSEQVHIAMGNRDIADTTYTDQLTMMGPTANVVAKGLIENNAKGQPTSGQAAGSGVQSPYIYSAVVQVAQPLFRAQIFDARRQTRIGIESADQALIRARQQLMFDTATYFIAVLQAREQVIVAEGAVHRAEQSLAAANQKFKAGAVLQTQVLLAEIELNRAQTSLNTANGLRLAQESGFERLMGQAPPEVLTLPPTPAREAVENAVGGFPEGRADLRSLHLATLQARATVSQLQHKIFWPTLDAIFQGGYGVFKASEGSTVFRYPTYGVTGQLTVPLFQTGDEWLQVKLQKERAYIAAYQESLRRRQVGDDVRTAIARLETADKAIEIAVQQQNTAQKNYQAVSNQYKLGAATELDVVTAQGAVFEAESNRAASQYEREIATYQLLFAEGKISL